MIARAKGFLEMPGAIPSDFEQSIGELGVRFVLNPVKAFADSFGNRFRQALPGESGQLPGKLVGIFVLDIQAHMVDILPFLSTILPRVDFSEDYPPFLASSESQRQLLHARNLNSFFKVGATRQGSAFPVKKIEHPHSFSLWCGADESCRFQHRGHTLGRVNK